MIFPRRRLLLAAAAVIGAFLLWTVGLQPALRTLREAPARIDVLDAAALRATAAGSSPSPPRNWRRSHTR